MPTTRTFGPFRLEKQLGLGGMGKVYLATYTKTGQKVALKILNPEFSSDEKITARFQREVEILKKLRHPNIVRYYGGGKIKGQRFYAMEVVEGGSLEKVLKEKGRLSWEQSLEYGIEICAALEHAHDHGIIHRDLKPANLFLTKDGKLKLGDFGIARAGDATKITAAGKTVGTYAYMAPEQITGKAEISARTDLYALGCVLYELITGRTPFEADTQAEMLFKHIEEDPPRIASLAIDCPIWLEEVVMHLLKKNPGDRPYDAPFVKMKLEEVNEKVAQQTGVATEVAAGTQSTVPIAYDHPELRKLIKQKRKKRKKKRSNEPLYEQTWFLATCFALVVGFITWVLWPPSEKALFEQAQALMQQAERASDRERDHILLRAREEYVLPLLERFPEGEYADEAQEFLDTIEMEQAKDKALAKARLGRPPDSEAQRLFLQAWKYEHEVGDKITAMQTYRSLVEFFEGEEQHRAYVNLARHRIAEIKQQASEQGGRVEVVKKKLDEAAQLYQEGNTVEARTIWENVVELYASDQELKPLVERARARLEGRTPETVSEDDAGEAGESSQQDEAAAGKASSDTQ